MDEVPAGQVVRKGITPNSRSSVWAAMGGAEVGGELLPSTGTMLLGVVGLQVDFGQLTLQGRVRYGWSGASNTFLTIDQRLAGGDLAVLKLVDVGSLATGFGLRVGGAWFQQSFTTAGEAPDRSGVVYRAGALLQVGWAFSYWSTLFVELAAHEYFLRVQDVASGEVGWDAQLVPTATVGLTFNLD